MNSIAPKGQVWVCTACGKISRDKFGMQRISYGYDESCMINSILCFEDKLVFDETKSRVIKVLEDGVVKSND